MPLVPKLVNSDGRRPSIQLKMYKVIDHEVVVCLVTASCTLIKMAVSHVMNHSISGFSAPHAMQKTSSTLSNINKTLRDRSRGFD